MHAGDTIRHDNRTWRIHTTNPDTTVLISLTAYPTQRLTIPTHQLKEIPRG